MELQTHQKAKAAWQSKYGYYKFRWGCKRRFQKNQLFPPLLNDKQKKEEARIKGEVRILCGKGLFENHAKWCLFDKVGGNKR